MKKDERKKLNRQKYANADIVVSPAIGQGSFEGHSSYASRVTKRREGRDPLRVSPEGREHKRKQAMEICKRAPAGRKKNEEDRTKKVRMKKGKKI
jgi:hypothetical protein